MVIVNTVVYVRGYLGGSDTATAVALAAAGAGSMLAALFLPPLLAKIPERLVMLAGSAFMALGLGLGMLQPGFSALLAIWFLLGLGASLVQTPVGRLLQASCRAADRSAYFSAHFALSHGCWLATYPLAGWLGATAGFPATFAVLGVLALAATIAALRAWPAEGPLALEHVHGALDHRHLHVHDEHHQHVHEGWEGPEPHGHPHQHVPITHRHRFVIDLHHRRWPDAAKD